MEDSRRRIEAFIARYMRPPRSERWQSVLSGKPAKWIGVSSWDLWDDSHVVDAQDWEGDLAGLAARLGVDAAEVVTVYCVGPSGGAVFEEPLREFLASDWPVEFVAVAGDRPVAFAANDQGHVRLFTGGG